MSKWLCYGVVSGTKYLGTVEAETEDEAIEKASNLDTCGVRLCHQCSSECEDPEIDRIEVEEDDG